jgi:hypothetical protein
MSRGVLLFTKYDLRRGLETQRSKAEHQISTLPQADLLPQVEASLLKRLFEEYRANPLELVANGITVEQQDAQVDVRHDPMRFVRDRSRPAYVPGQRVRYYVEYRGDRVLWECRPSQFTLNPPGATEITDTELVFEFLVPGTDVAVTKVELDEQLRRINGYLGSIRIDVEQHNNSLMPAFSAALARRRDAVAKTLAGVEALGLPIRNRPAPESPRSASTPARRTPSGKRSTTKRAFAFDVALSFAGEDRAYVEQVAKLLKDSGVEVFYDRYEQAKLWGKNLADHLADVYGKQSRFVVMFISEQYVKKAWPTHERQNAHARALREQRAVLLPARFDDTEVPGLPSTVGHVNLRTTTPADLADLILKKLEDEG